MSTKVSTLVQQMAAQKTYDTAWLFGLEIQSMEDTATAINVFSAILAKDVAVFVRRAAAFWLTDEAEHIPSDLLLKMAQDADAEIRFHAAYGLSYAEHPQAVATLRTLLKDVSEDVRQTAVQSIYAAGRLNGFDDAVIVADFETMLAQESSAKVREEIVISLANFLRSKAVVKATALLESAKDDEVEIVREQAIISLSMLRDEVWHHNDELILTEEL